MTPTCVEQLPDDLTVLKGMIVDREMALIGRQLQIERIERQAAIAVAERDERIAEREALIAEREALIEQVRREAAEQMEAQRQRHKAEVDALLRRFYGPHNERFDPTQLLLFGRLIDTMPLDTRAVEQEAKQPLKDRRAKNRHKHGRGRLPEHLPREIVNHDLPDAQKVDADGKPLVYIGYEPSEQLEFRPGGFFVVEHRRFKYAPADYQHSDTGARIIIADKPLQPIEKGLAGPGLLAHVITGKLADHLPLYRLERIFARDGVHIAQSTMCGWILAAAELLTPLVLLMKQRVKQSRFIHADDTRVPVQRGSTDSPRAKGSTCRSGRIWDWIGDGANPYIIFEYAPDRTNTWPIAWLEGFTGFLQADAYSGYDAIYKLGKVIEVGCWAHARRKFFDARQTDSLRSARMLEMVQQLYKVEQDAAKAIAAMKDATPRQAEQIRLELRQSQSVPVLEKIKAWLDEQAKLVLPRSPMAEAISYSLNQWAALRVYADHGFLNIDNNAAERALKLIALGRKNWLFVQNDKFGAAYATLYSLIASAQRHELDPRAYLRGVLAQIAVTPLSELPQFLPDVWKSRLQAEAAANKASEPATLPTPAPSPATISGPGP